MMRGRNDLTVFTVATAAGSAGKTTTVVTLAVLAAATTDKPVYLVDADPQADATHLLGGATDSDRTLAAVIQGRTPMADALQPTAHGVTLLGSDPQVAGDVDQLRASKPMAYLTCVSKALRDLPPGEGIVFIDCPGALYAGLTAPALLAADHVLTCTNASAKETKGIADVAAFLEEGRDSALTEADIDAVIVCAVPAPSRHATAQDHLATIRRDYPQAAPPVRWSTKVSESYDAGTPLPTYAPHAAVTRDYRAVWDHLRTRSMQ